VTQDLEPLPSDVAQLLARGATPVEPPAHVRERLRERLTTAIVGPAAFSSAPLSSWARLQGLATVVGKSRAFIGFAGVLAGAATVLALRSTPSAMPPAPAVAPLTEPSVAVPAAETSTPSPEARQVVPSRAPEATVPAPAPIVHRKSFARSPIEVAAAENTVSPTEPAPQTPAAVHVSHWGLQAEGELLQKGRTAMVRGDIEGALAAVEEHASRFPQGKLSEEREALKIQALVAEDRDPEARAALVAFHQTYPKSLLGPALEEAVVGKIQ